MDEATGAGLLLCAVLHRAVLDARRGDAAAVAWLKDEAPGLLTWFDIAPSVTRKRVELVLARRKLPRLHTLRKAG